MRALVTGADGFVGRWLTEHLTAAGDDVWQATGPHADEGPRRRRVELLDRSSVTESIDWAQPDAIYHLAGMAFGPDVGADIGAAVDVTVRGTGYVLEAARARPQAPVIFVPSSSEVYGAPVEQPVDESQPLAPVNAYGATKVAQEALALASHREHGLPVVVARAFNHIGPGQRESFVVAAFASQLAEIVAGRAEPVLRVGNLDAERDFSDVRDVVLAYRALVAGGHVGRPVNVASGRGIRIGDLLDRLIATAGAEVHIEVVPELLRPVDVPIMRGNADALVALTGWRPIHTLDATLRDVWDEMRIRHGLVGAGGTSGATPAS
jgi:GDP-4-dehydro-6-deoxy-D-mannose reductase